MRRRHHDTPLKLIPQLRRHATLAAALSAAIAACVVVQALALAQALAVGVDGGAWQSTLVPAMVAAMAVILRGGLGWIGEVAGRRAGSAAMVHLRNRLVRATLRGVRPVRGERESGELATLTVHGGAAVERWAGRAVLQRSLAVATPAAAIVTMALVDPLSAALLAPTIPLLVVFLVLAGSDARRVANERLAVLTLLGGHMLDVLRGLPVLRSFGRAHIQEGEMAVAGDAYRRSTNATLRSAFTSSFALEFMAMLGTALVAVVAGVRLVHGSMEFEPAMAVLLLAPELYVPLRNVGTEYHAAADARATIDRVWEAGTSPGTVPDGRSGSGSIDPRGNAIVVRDVTVRPPGAERATLTGCSLRLDPGTTTVLVGPSGAGKSTLIRILLGLEQPHSGTVMCAGRSLEHMDLDDWRRRVAWLPQHPVVLPASLADNLLVAAPDATVSELWTALRTARLDIWAQTLPRLLDTPLGDGGVAISAGERRRLGLARAALRRPALILADEPTANLDSDTAALVLESLADLVAGRTALIVTHEPDVLAQADRVVALDADGRVVDSVPEAAYS